MQTHNPLRQETHHANAPHPPRQRLRSIGIRIPSGSCYESFAILDEVVGRTLSAFAVAWLM
jgi:hypothetical protein